MPLLSGLLLGRAQSLFDAAAARVFAIASVIKSSAGWTSPAPPVAAATPDPDVATPSCASALPSTARETSTRFMLNVILWPPSGFGLRPLSFLENLNPSHVAGVRLPGRRQHMTIIAIHYSNII